MKKSKKKEQLANKYNKINIKNKLRIKKKSILLLS